MTETVAVAIPPTPTKASPDGIYVYHNTDDEVSLGVELDEGVVTGALAICSPKDQFSKKKAQLILRNRLDKKRFNFLTFPLGRYSGKTFKDDVFIPLMNHVRDKFHHFVLEEGERGDQNDEYAEFVGYLQGLTQTL